jgi:hypothetical protein
MTPYEIYARDAVCRQPVYLSSPRESVAMTLFRVRHELRMWHDCWGLHDGEEPFWANSGEWSLSFQIAIGKWWCDIMMPLGRAARGRNSEFERYGDYSGMVKRGTGL